MKDETYQKPKKILWHDRIVEKTILNFLPDFITPNQITLFRLLATPVVALLIVTEQYILSIIIFFILSLTDMIDGSLARTKNRITEWGKQFDPLADKVLISVMIATIGIKYLNFYLAISVVIIEVILILSSVLRKLTGDKSLQIQSNFWGKTKMVFQVLGVILLFAHAIINKALLINLSTAIFLIAIIFALGSLASYSI